MGIALSPDDLAKRYRSLNHLDHFQTDVALLRATAVEQGVSSAALAFMDGYAQHVHALVLQDQNEVIEDRIAAENYEIDPAQIEINYQARQQRELALRLYVKQSLTEFLAPDRQQDFEALVAYYSMLANAIDRTSNFLVQENDFDLGRAERDRMRQTYNPDEPRRKRPVLQGDEGVPGGLERLAYPMQGGRRHHYTPDSPEKFLYGTTEAELDAFIADVAATHYRETITAHPTEILHQRAARLYAAFYETKRELLQAPEARRAEITQRLREITRDLTRSAAQFNDPAASLIKLDTDGAIANFTTADEIDNAEPALRQRFEALLATYGTYWRFLESSWGKKFTPERKRLFHLDYALSSWVGNDIDGNFNKKFEHSLLEDVRDMKLLFSVYAEKLHELEQAGEADLLGNAPRDWRTRFEDAARSLEELQAELRHRNNGDLVLTLTEGDQMLATIQRVLHGLDSGNRFDRTPSAQNFVKDMSRLFTTASATNAVAATRALELSKLAETFGFHLSRKEYRQTADQHSRIVDFLIDFGVASHEKTNYANMSEEDQSAWLNERLLKNPAFLQEKINAFLASAEVGDGAGLRNTEKDVRALALQTIRFLRKAAAQPHSHQRMVLAEYRHVGHYLEALALQQACGARLHVTPLLEERDTLRDYKKLFSDSVTTPAILKHFSIMANGDLMNLSQYWMAAYSDNIKRFGISTRILIDDQWRNFSDYIENFFKANAPQMKQAFAAAGITVDSAQDFCLRLLPMHGKSSGHACRDGQRAQTAFMHDYVGYFIRSIGVYFDHTSQGRDVTASVVDALKRNWARIFSEGAIMHALFRFGKNNQHKLSDPLVAMFSEAVQRAQDDFRESYFGELSPHGYALAHPVGADPITKLAANAGSRAAMRIGGGKGNLYARGAMRATTPVAPGAMRAITVVEDQAHLGSRLSALGIRRLETFLNQGFLQKPELKGEWANFVQREQQQQAFNDSGHLTTASLVALRKALPFFRKLTDEIAFALVSSDLAGYAKSLREAAALEGVPITTEVQQDLDNRRQDYLSGSLLTLKSFGIDPLLYDKPAEHIDQRITRFRYLLSRLALPNSTTEISLARSFDLFGTLARNRLTCRLWKEGNDTAGDRAPNKVEAHCLRLLAAARLAFTHGNFPTVSGPLLGEDLMRRFATTAKRIGLGSAAAPAPA